MTQGFEVDTGELRSHGAKIGDVQGQAAEAADAGQQVTPGGWDNAYGVICQSFPQLLRPIADRGISAIQKVSDAFGDQSQQLGQAADAYDELDRQIADNLQKILRDLEKIGRGISGG